MLSNNVIQVSVLLLTVFLLQFVQKQDDTHPSVVVPSPSDMDSELLITLVNGAVNAITTRLQSKNYGFRKNDIS